MGNEHKDIKITPNTSQSAKPKIEVTGADNAVKTLTINDDGSITYDGALSVSDLTVSGTTTTINTETLTIDDNIIVLNNNVTGTPSEDAGIEIERGTSTNATFLYDETNDVWVADSKATAASLQVKNQHGYIEFGPQNTSYAHITTDRSRFYFNRDLVIGENAISSYNGDFAIRRNQETDEQISIGDNSMTFTSAGNDVVTVDGTNTRLGVNNASPSSTLHVTGDITASAEIQGSQFRLSGSANRFGLPATNEIGIFTDSTERVRIDNTGRVGIGTTDPVSPLHIDHNVSNPSTDAPNSFGIWVDADLSGSTATGGDREQGGIYVDLDSSATGGDSSDEHRPYGVWADVRLNNESDADSVVGIYGYTEAQRSGSTAATTFSVRGGYFFSATDETSDHTVSELTGALGYASIQDAGTVTTSQGLRAYTNVHSGRTTNVGNLRGVSAEVDISGGRTDGSDITTGNSSVFRALLDHNPAASGEGTVTIADSYLYYGSSSIIDSSQVTNNFGLYLTGEDKNYFSGKVGIGVSAPTDTLSVDGGIAIGRFVDFPSNNTGTGAGDPQLRIAGRGDGDDQPGIIQLAQFDGNNFFGGTSVRTLGKIQFAMNENSNDVTTVAEIRGITSDPATAGDFDGALKFFTSQGDGSGANLNEKMILNSDGYLGIGTTSPDGQLHISSGNSGDCTVIIEADEDNNAEGDVPRLWFKADGDITEGAVQLSDNELDIIQNSASAGGIRFLTGSTSNTGTTDPNTGASVRMDINDNGMRLGNGGARVTNILDEDDMSSNSSTALATQQSIKAYVDSQSGGIASVAADSTPQLGGDLDVNGNKITSASDADITIEPNGTGDVNLFTDTVVVGDSNANFQMQHRTTTASILEFQAGGNTRLNSDGNIYLNTNQGGGSNTLIRLNGNTITSGTPNANVTMTTQGTGDLTLSTNSGTNSGTIKIFDGANGNIELTPNGTGNVSIGNFTFNADQTVGSSQDNYVLTYDNSTQTIGLEAASGGGSGDITSVVAGNGLTGGATSGDATLTVGAGTGINVSSTQVSVDVSDFMTNGVNNRVLTATGADSMNAESNMTFNGSTLVVAGFAQAYKTTIRTVSSNTTLADADSGKTVYWTGGTLTLPSTAQQGQQYVIINNTGGAATPSLGTSNSIATGWTAHAAMADETARTYIAVATNTWIYIG